jgi:hypothetical protein
MTLWAVGQVLGGLVVCATIAVCTLYITKSTAQSAKDSKKYAASGGWGYADFTNRRPGDRALHEKCFPCHVPAKDHDYVFTHYAPTP